MSLDPSVPDRTPPPAPDRTAAGAPGGDSLAAALLEQCRRWRQGERVLVEAYLEQHPALRADANAVLDLLYNEFVLRDQRGEKPQLDEYLERFPELAPELRVQFECAPPPLGEGHVPSPNGAQPLGRLTSDRQLKLSGL